MTLMFDSWVILKGEIRYWSLYGKCMCATTTLPILVLRVSTIFQLIQNYNKILKHDWLSPAQFEHQ